MRRRLAMLFGALLLSACGDDVAHPDGGAPDDLSVVAPLACAFADGTSCGGAGSANRGCAVDACNWCDCGPGWGGTDRASCTEVGCNDPDGGGSSRPCASQADCSSDQACIFAVGCDQTHGQCNSQIFYCPHDPRTFTLCDCDGHTIVDAVNSCAPDRRYAHVGPCT
ncbi:MAG: hypothetical protein ACXVAN_19100 [Polyangia bacterium]